MKFLLLNLEELSVSLVCCLVFNLWSQMSQRLQPGCRGCLLFVNSQFTATGLFWWKNLPHACMRKFSCMIVFLVYTSSCPASWCYVLLYIEKKDISKLKTLDKNVQNVLSGVNEGEGASNPAWGCPVFLIWSSSAHSSERLVYWVRCSFPFIRSWSYIDNPIL